MAKIRQNADVAGINPANLKGTETFVIIPPCVTEEERKAKSGGKFTQYKLHLSDVNAQERELRFLFERDLAPLSRKYGEDTDAWTGKEVSVTAQKGEDGYWSVVLQ